MSGDTLSQKEKIDLIYFTNDIFTDKMEYDSLVTIRDSFLPAFGTQQKNTQSNNGNGFTGEPSANSL